MWDQSGYTVREKNGAVKCTTSFPSCFLTLVALKCGFFLLSVKAVLFKSPLILTIESCGHLCTGDAQLDTKVIHPIFLYSVHCLPRFEQTIKLQQKWKKRQFKLLKLFIYYIFGCQLR